MKFSPEQAAELADELIQIICEAEEPKDGDERAVRVNLDWLRGMIVQEALAQEVKDKAVEIVRNNVTIVDSYHAVHDYDAVIRAIAAIPITSPTSIGLAYEAAALKRAIEEIRMLHLVWSMGHPEQLKSFSDALEQAIFSLITPEGETALNELERDAKRYQAVRNFVGAFKQGPAWNYRFQLQHLNPADGADLFKGSVAQHFDDAIDATLNQHSKKD